MPNKKTPSGFQFVVPKTVNSVSNDLIEAGKATRSLADALISAAREARPGTPAAAAAAAVAAATAKAKAEAKKSTSAEEAATAMFHLASPTSFFV